MKFKCENLWNEEENSTLRQKEQYTNLFREAVTKYYENEWKQEPRNSSKLAVYATCKSDIVKEKYLGILTLKKFLVTMARFRTSSHTLEIELGRHKGTLFSQRICEYCELRGSTCIEDEFHLVLNCPMYGEIRQRYFSVETSNDYNLFIQIMTNQEKIHIINFATFLKEGFTKRQLYFQITRSQKSDTVK